MIRYLGGRLFQAVSVLLVVSVGTMFLVNLTPGDPAYSILGPGAAASQVRTIDRQLHLTGPLLSRYWYWLDNLLHWNFGSSYVTKLPVTHLISAALPATAEEIALALLVAFLVSVPIGIYTAYRAGGRFDHLWTVVTSALVSSPVFVSALLLVYVFALKLDHTPFGLPATGWVPLTQSVGQNIGHAVLPSLTLAGAQIPTFSRLLRSDMIATLQEDYILAARASGVPTRRILLRHALRPSSFSLVTVAGVSLGALISGAVVVEVLFAVPGIGQLLVGSVFNKDIPVVQGVVMFTAILYVGVNALLDLLYGYLDPRVRFVAG